MQVSFSLSSLQVSHLLQGSVDRRRRATPIFVHFQTSYTCFALVMQAWNAGITSFTDDPAVDRQMVAGLHHVADVVFTWRAVRGYGSRTDTVSYCHATHRRTETCLGPVPPENMVVTPDAIASSAC